MTVKKILLLLVAAVAALAAGCAASDVSNQRILDDARGRMTMTRPGANIVDSILKERHYETPSILSAQVEMTIERPSVDPRERFRRHVFRMTYQKVSPKRWELVDVNMPE